MALSLSDCPLCASHLYSFIIRQVHHCMASTFLFSWHLLSHPSLRHHSLLRIRPSAEATAEDHRCRLPPQTAQAATRMRQPTSNQHGYPWVCAKRREARADLSYPCLSSRAMLNFLLAIISAIYNVKFCAKKHIMYHLYNT